MRAFLSTNEAQHQHMAQVSLDEENVSPYVPCYFDLLVHAGMRHHLPSYINFIPSDWGVLVVDLVHLRSEDICLTKGPEEAA